MMRHFFIAPVDVISPRWTLAFPDAILLDSASVPQFESAGNLVWVFIEDEQSLKKSASWISAGAQVIAMTQAENPTEAKQALEAGAKGYVHYLSVTSVLQQVAAVVEQGGLWMGVDLLRQLIAVTANILKANEPMVALEQLTAREKGVAEAVAAGKTNKEVARDLGITERTVKAHLGAVFEKLNVRDRLQLVLVMSGR